MVQIKSMRELELMKKVGEIVGIILSTLTKNVKPGISLIEIDREAERLCLEYGSKPAFKGYKGYPASICTSVNDQVVHGIPCSRVLNDGDIVGLDFGLLLDGYYGDSAVTVPVGKVSEPVTQLLRATFHSLYAGIKAARVGNTIRDISLAVENTVKPFGYGIVKDFVGHGIGKKLHEDPQIPNYAEGASNFPLRAGMTLAIEPMINMGGASVKILEDGWTAVTKDGSLSAHYEHSLAVTEGDPIILTEWKNGSYHDFWEKELCQKKS